MRLQFAAVVLGLTLIPVHVFGCTCTLPTAQVKTTSELAPRNCELTARREPVGRHHWDYQRLVMRDIKGKTGELAQLNRQLAQLTGAGLPVPF